MSEPVGERHAVFGIGHSNHNIERFVGLLLQHGVKTLLDVRTYAFSRWHPQFRKDALAARLEKQAIRYEHWPKLGGKNPLTRPELDRETERAMAGRSNVAIMCSEGDFHQCHRHYLLTPLLLELGFKVMQIKPDGHVVEDSGPTEATIAKYLHP